MRSRFGPLAPLWTFCLKCFAIEQWHFQLLSRILHGVLELHVIRIIVIDASQLTIIVELRLLFHGPMPFFWWGGLDFFGTIDQTSGHTCSTPVKVIVCLDGCICFRSIAQTLEPTSMRRWSRDTSRASLEESARCARTNREWSGSHHGASSPTFPSDSSSPSEMRGRYHAQRSNWHAVTSQILSLCRCDQTSVSS